ncbi:MAG: alpha/beta hydrolase [Rubrivivax sp.]
MDSSASRTVKPDAGHSRFGESRFGESRFSQSRFSQGRIGEWVEEGRPDAQGRVSGLYRTAGSGGEGAVTGLTVVRPPPRTSASSAAAATSKAEKGAPTKALHLPGGRSGVLLFHGLTSTPLELQFLARGLHRAGHSVRIAVIDGYTHGLPAKGPSGHREWAAAAVAEFDRMRSSCETLAVGGLCIGALLSLHVAAERPNAASHVMALSTALHYDGWAAPRSRWLLPIVPFVPGLGNMAIKEREPFGVKDERLRAWIGAQMKESGGSDAGAAALRVRDLFEAQRLMKLVRGGMKEIKAPTLLIHARDDDAASPRSAFEVAGSVSSERVQCVLLNESYHMISIDQEKAKVLSEMKKFMQSGQMPETTAPLRPPMASANSKGSRHVSA